MTAAGWVSGERLGWTIEAQRGAERGFCGSIDLRLEGDGVAEVGFGLHPGRARPLDHDSRLASWSARTGSTSLACRPSAGERWSATGRRDGLRARRIRLRRPVIGGCWCIVANCCDGWIATLTRDDPRRAAAMA